MYEDLFKTTCDAQLWISCQLLHAVAQAHARGVCHGDIKCENVLVTSWSWAVLTDFAPYKPTYLPADNTVRITAPCLSPQEFALRLRCRSYTLGGHALGVCSTQPSLQQSAHAPCSHTIG